MISTKFKRKQKHSYINLAHFIIYQKMRIMITWTHMLKFMCRMRACARTLFGLREHWKFVTLKFYSYFNFLVNLCFLCSALIPKAVFFTSSTKAGCISTLLSSFWENNSMLWPKVRELLYWNYQFKREQLEEVYKRRRWSGHSECKCDGCW